MPPTEPERTELDRAIIKERLAIEASEMLTDEELQQWASADWMT